MMEFHHDVTAAPVSQDLIAIVHLSDLLCRHRWLGYGYDEARQIDFKCSPAWLVLGPEAAGRWDVQTSLALARELEEYFDEVVFLSWTAFSIRGIVRPKPVVSSN